MAWHEKTLVRLLVPIVLVLSVSIGLSLTWLSIEQRRQALDHAREDAALISGIIKTGLRAQMLKTQEDLIASTLAEIGENPDVAAISVLSPQGTVVYASDGAAVGTVPDPDTEGCAACHARSQHGRPDIALVTNERGEMTLRSVRPIANEPECQSCHGDDDALRGVLLVDRNMGKTIGELAQARKSLIAVSVVTLLLILGLMTWIVHVLVQRPVDALLAGTRRVRRGDLVRPVQIEFRGELAELGDAFNGMVDSLRAQMEEIESKSLEISTLYSMVERLGKTINLTELRRVILDIIPEVFSDVELQVMGFHQEEGAGVHVHVRRAAGKVRRTIVPSDDAGSYREVGVSESMADLMVSQGCPDVVAGDSGREALAPLKAADRRLGFLYIRKLRGARFDERALHLLQALSSHISVALDNARLYTMAITDELTHLYTLRYLQTTLAKEVGRYHRYSQSLSLLMLDLDDFKQINDGHGHLAGDTVLEAVARRIVAAVREVDVACRYGGEEFAVILPQTPMKAAVMVAERIRERVAGESFMLEHGPETVTVSVGVASCSETTATVRDLIAAADRALYQAKKEGKNRVVATERTAATSIA